MLDVALSDAFKDTIMVLSLLALLAQKYLVLVQKYVRSKVLDVALSDAFMDTILVQKYKYYWYKCTETYKY